MATGHRQWDRARLLQGVVLLVLSTLVLTASFLGVVALVTAGVTGLTDRLPFYVLAMAVAFVGGIVFLEDELREGRRILQASAGLALVTFLLVSLGGEGVAFTLQRPDQVLTSQLLFYLLAAGLIGSGLGYWGLNHWGDFASPRSGM